MRLNKYTEAPKGLSDDCITDPSFLDYQAGFLDGHSEGYRKGVTDTAETNAARAEHTARLFYAMTAEDADRRRLTHAVSTALETANARREAGEWARRHCTYAGGPVNFLTGEPVGTEGSTK